MKKNPQEASKDSVLILRNKMIKEIKIGFLTYNVNENKHMSSEDLGEIHYDELEININKKTSNNYRIKKSKAYEVLLHEIVHGIDYAVKFTKKDKENTVDLIAFYITSNINNLQDTKFSHFKKYLSNYEIKIKREKALFKTILHVLNDNPKLIKKIKRVFG